MFQQTRDHPRPIQGAHHPPPPCVQNPRAGARAGHQGGARREGSASGEARAGASGEARPCAGYQEGGGREEGVRPHPPAPRTRRGTPRVGERVAVAWLELIAENPAKK